MATLAESLSTCEAAAAAAGVSASGGSYNFPTAYRIALAGYPIARRAWAGQYDAAPARWITCERGVWWDNRAGVRSILVQGEAPSLTEADYLAADWRVPAGSLVSGIAERPGFPRPVGGGSTPTFDVYNPPSRI